MKKSGFTVIELMIAIAIIGILAAIAIPSYEYYVTRTHVSEGIYLATPAKHGIAEVVVMKGTFPSSNASAGVNPASAISGTYVSSVLIHDAGVITITYNSIDSELSGKTIDLTPSYNHVEGSVRWICSRGATNPVADKYIPSSCK